MRRWRDGEIGRWGVVDMVRLFVYTSGSDLPAGTSIIYPGGHVISGGLLRKVTTVTSL